MGIKVLVTYATKHGGTREIAETIGHALGQAGVYAEVMPVDHVDGLKEYTAVVLGSAVYYGRWRKQAADFLKTRERELANRPLWIFSSGPTGEGDPNQLVRGWRLPESLRPVVDRLDARDIAIFHGSIERERLGLFERLIIQRVKAAVGDFRDWQTVKSWARGIAKALQNGEKPLPEATRLQETRAN